MKYLAALFLVVSCATAQVVDFPESIPVPFSTPEIGPHKYSVGQCFQVFDPKTGKTNRNDIVRVEAIDPTSYTYRWWTYLQNWAIDTNIGIGRFELFESMTKEVKCPK